MIAPLPPQQEEVGDIQGKTPGSIQEWWVAQALWKHNVQFIYQFEIFGGTHRRGGLIVDFAVWSPDFNGLEVFGEYWHEGDMDGGDRTKIVALKSYFKKDPIILWASDATTKEDVEQFVRNYVA